MTMVGALWHGSSAPQMVVNSLCSQNYYCFVFPPPPIITKIFCSLLASICKKLGGKYGHTMKNTIGLYTIHLTVMAVRLMVEYGMAKLLTICQAIFWDCLWPWDSCIMAKDGEKWWTEKYFVKSTIIYDYSIWTLHIWKKTVGNIDLYSLYSADSFIASPLKYCNHSFGGQLLWSTIDNYRDSHSHHWIPSSVRPEGSKKKQCQIGINYNLKCK